MNFEKLLAKMVELDQPMGEAQIQECPPMDAAPMPSPSIPEVSPPSMSVNLNAQGLDNIEQILKLITKVNPDAAPQDASLPALTAPAGIASIASPEIPPLKMLPDFDKEEPEDSMDKTGDDKMNVIKIGGDEENEAMDDDDQYEPYGGEHDPDPDSLHGYEKYKAQGGKLSRDQWEFDQSQRNPWDKEDEENKEEYENEPDTEYKDADYMNNRLAGGMNRQKGTFPKVAGGDNPMQKKQFESGDLRAQIRAELLQRLAEAKGEK